jgi:TonB family protein
MIHQSSIEWEESGLFTLFRSPFLIPSVLFHALVFLLAIRATTLTLAKPQKDAPISVQLLEARDGGSRTQSIGPAVGPGGPRTMPKLGTSAPPAERRGKTQSGSLETLVPLDKPVEATPPPEPVTLPGPKVLAVNPRAPSVNPSETAPDSLVGLPTRDAATQLPASATGDAAANQRLAALSKDAADSAGIKALREGTQIPGALKGGGTAAGPYGVPGGRANGTGLAGAGSGAGTGGGSMTGLRGLSSVDYNEYLNRLKKRVESVWKFPEGVSGVQKVSILFTLDRAGRLVQSEVLESTDARMNASAVEAMKRAAPFAPIPESLKDLANTPLRMQFTVTVGVRG